MARTNKTIDRQDVIEQLKLDSGKAAYRLMILNKKKLLAKHGRPRGKDTFYTLKRD